MSGGRSRVAIGQQSPRRDAELDVCREDKLELPVPSFLPLTLSNTKEARKVMAAVLLLL